MIFASVISSEAEKSRIRDARMNRMRSDGWGHLPNPAPPGGQRRPPLRKKGGLSRSGEEFHRMVGERDYRTPVQAKENRRHCENSHEAVVPRRSAAGDTALVAFRLIEKHRANR